MPPFARDLFFPSHAAARLLQPAIHGLPHHGPRHRHRRRPVPASLPRSIAIGYGLDGLTGARRAVGVWAILGVLALSTSRARGWWADRRRGPARFSCRCTSSRSGSRATRTPKSSCRRCCFAALLAIARAHVDGDEFFAPVAGVAARTAAVPALRRRSRHRRRAGRSRAVVLARDGAPPSVVLRAACAAVSLLACRICSDRCAPTRIYPIVFLSSLAWWHYAAAAQPAASCASRRCSPARACRASEACGSRLVPPRSDRRARRLGASTRCTCAQPVHGVLAEHDAYALRTFTTFYLTLPGLLAALVGFALFARRAFWRAPELFTTAAVFAFFFFYKIRIVRSTSGWRGGSCRSSFPWRCSSRRPRRSAACGAGRRRRGCCARPSAWSSSSLLAMQYASGRPARAAARRVSRAHPQARNARGRNRRSRPAGRRIARCLRYARPRDCRSRYIYARNVAAS